VFSKLDICRNRADNLLGWAEGLHRAGEPVTRRRLDAEADKLCRMAFRDGLGVMGYAITNDRRRKAYAYCA
jgi:hypothetical protein